MLQIVCKLEEIRGFIEINPEYKADGKFEDKTMKELHIVSSSLATSSDVAYKR